MVESSRPEDLGNGEVLPTRETGSPSDGSVNAKTAPNCWGRLRSYLNTDISLSHADIPIIACCLVSGLCDSSAYNAWTCFVSMQTGNTIFLALGASGQPTSHPDGWLKSLVSISFFLIGCLFFSFTRTIDAKAKGTLTGSFFIQSCCLIIAAALVQGGYVPEPQGLMELPETFNARELIPLAFLAFQSAGQMVTSRLLGFNEVPTTVLTSVYCDIAIDPKVLKRDNVKRNRRVAAVISILVGGIAGGWISRSSAGMSVSLWIAAAIKMGIALSWSVWKPQSPLRM